MKLFKRIVEESLEVDADFLVVDEKTLTLLLRELREFYDLEEADNVTILQYMNMLPLVNIYQREPYVFAKKVFNAKGPMVKS